MLGGGGSARRESHERGQARREGRINLEISLRDPLQGFALGSGTLG